MPIIFITLSETFAEKAHSFGFTASVQKIQDYVPNKTRRTYYVSPANSLCFMDGGIDLALSRIVFPGIETEVKRRVRKLGIFNLLGRPYLPIGSSIIVDVGDTTSLVVSPTMLLPQNVATTKNAYYCTLAVLYNILENRKELLEDVDILFTSFCCGYGKMDEDESIRQILAGIQDYKSYAPTVVDPTTIVKTPNMSEQPAYYQNTEFFPIEAERIVRC